MTEEPRYEFDTTCPHGHRVTSLFGRAPFRRALAMHNTHPLELYCVSCRRFYPLTKAQVDQARRDLE